MARRTAARLVRKGETTTFTLDGAGRITQQVHANGTYLGNTYSAARGWPTVLEHRRADHSVLIRYEYARDYTGRIATSRRRWVTTPWCTSMTTS